MANGHEMDQELIIWVKNRSLTHKNMKFSQEQVNDTIIPKVNMSNNKKNKNVGKELAQRTQDLNNNIESIMGKSAKTESLPISDGLVMCLYDVDSDNKKYVRVDFKDYSTYNRSYILMNRTKLKEMADFIYKYLENK